MGNFVFLTYQRAAGMERRIALACTYDDRGTQPHAKILFVWYRSCEGWILNKHILNFFSSFCNISERLNAINGSAVNRRLAWSAALHLVSCITAVAVLSFLSESSIMYQFPAILFLEIVAVASVFGLSPARKYITKIPVYAQD